MRNVLVTILSLLLCLCLVACGAMHLDDKSGETPAASNPESAMGVENVAAKIPVVYAASSDTLTDRVLFTADTLFMSYTARINDLDRGCAMCLVTVMDIDLDGVSGSDIGVTVPLTLRVDKIILSNDAFTLKEGDCFSSADCTKWFKTGDVYSVNISDGRAPVAELGALYFGLLLAGSCDYNPVDFDVDYTFECHTLPIPAISVSANEVATQFAEMKLPCDLRETSVGIIKMLCGESFIPDYDDIKAAFEEIVG